MNSKVIIFVIVVVVIIAAIFFLPTGQEELAPVERFAPEQTQREMQPQGSAPAPDGVPAPPIDSLHVAVQDSNGTEVGHLTLRPDAVQPLAGTAFSLRLTDFYTHLVMHENEPVNMSPHPENMAARIEILENGDVVDYTWTFEKVPFFRMGGMGGHGRVANTGLAFALEEVYGLPEAHSHDTNP